MDTDPTAQACPVPQPGPMITEEQRIEISNKKYISQLAILGRAFWSAVLVLGGVAGFLISRLTSEGISQDATILTAAAIRYNFVLAFCLVILALGVFFFITAYTEQELKGSKNHIGWYLGLVAILASPIALMVYGNESKTIIVNQLEKMSATTIQESNQLPSPPNN